jgi:hypothetical protein
LSHDAWRKDREAEEKWLENYGEDEEFLKCKGKMLNRDLLRIAPVYIGGSAKMKSHIKVGDRLLVSMMLFRDEEGGNITSFVPPSSLALTPPKGVLLHGNLCTGKTLVVKALIGACSQVTEGLLFLLKKVLTVGVNMLVTLRDSSDFYFRLLNDVNLISYFLMRCLILLRHLCKHTYRRLHRPPK